MLSRNLIYDSGTLGKLFPDISVFTEIRSLYLSHRLQEMLNTAHLVKAIDILADKSRLEEVLTRASNHSIIACDIVFPEGNIRTCYRHYFSQVALSRFDEDRAFLQTWPQERLYAEALEFVYVIYEAFFTYRLREYDLNNLLVELIRHPRSLDILTDAVGIPCFLLVMSDMPADWIENNVQGCLLHLYKQWKKGSISINDMHKWKKESSRDRFLLQLLILSHLGCL